MREIKFRAWDGKEMHYAPLIHMITSNDFEGTCGYNKKFSAETGAILMQYTGLKDKNGKEIYEGDVVIDHTLAKWTGEVFFYIHNNERENHPHYNPSEEARFMTRGIYWHDKQYLYPMYRGHEYEVIGNIYENPELLERDNASR